LENKEKINIYKKEHLIKKISDGKILEVERIINKELKLIKIKENTKINILMNKFHQKK
jgi:hypothetical protein